MTIYVMREHDLRTGASEIRGIEDGLYVYWHADRALMQAEADEFNGRMSTAGRREYCTVEELPPGTRYWSHDQDMICHA